MNYLATEMTKSKAEYFSERLSAVLRVAHQQADSVDKEARFPAEAIAALKSQNLLSVLVSADLGGDGATLAEAAEICYSLGGACASTGMIYAMHLVKLACIINHGSDSPWHQALLARIAKEQLLLASSTTEGMNGGNVRSSAAAIIQNGLTITLDRDASVISYGAYADGIVTTARRSETSEASDQVLAVFLKENYTMEPTSSWDTLGMRGTCSIGYRLKASGVAAQVLPHPYARIHTQTMTPAAHILWSSTWAGIAAAAVQKAENFVRKAMRGANGQTPPGAASVAQAKSKLRVLRALIVETIERYEAVHTDVEKSASLDYQSAIALTKVEASEMALSIVMSCYRTCGLSGYRNDSDVSIGRHLRDVLSSPIMINNERILSNMGTTLLMSGVPTRLHQ